MDTQYLRDRAVARLLGPFLILTGLPAIAAPAPPPYTFSRDIAPIFQDKCESCHRPGQGAPMNLRTYAEVRPWARSIRQRVAARAMPPWGLDPNIGVQKYVNDRSLTPKQIATIEHWVDEGAPEGDAKDLPKPKLWPEDSGWQYSRVIGRAPDFVVKSQDWTVPALGQDQWWKPVSDVPVPEERWIQAVEMHPGTAAGRKVTHHAVAELVQLEPDADAYPDGVGALAEWAIGKTYDAYRPGTGKLIVPGAKLRWDIHYHSVGEKITDHVELAVWLYPKDQKPAHRTRLTSLYAMTERNDLDIPPNSIAMTQGFQRLNSAARIENFQPHMHLRGKAMALQAILPDHTVRMLSYADRFTFNWINNYIYADDSAPVLPKGTILRTTAWYDNTAHNKDNPDANEWVGFGQRQVEEMGHIWTNITYLSDAEYAEWMASHKPAGTLMGAGVPLPAGTSFPQAVYQPPQESGQSVTPAYEGWWQNPDGTYNLLFGYFNRNTQESPDIPIGPNNHFEPGPADQGQPAHFEPRRHKGVFTVTVPKDFGDKKLTWTLTVNGRTLSVAGHLGAAWVLSPLKEIGIGNTPPVISLDQAGPDAQGPKPVIAERTVRTGEPLSLTVFAADDQRSETARVLRLRLESAMNRVKAAGQQVPFAAALTASEKDPDRAVASQALAEAAAAAGADRQDIGKFLDGDVGLTWEKYRGPGQVTFGAAQPAIEKTPGAVPVSAAFNGKSTTTAVFSQPGEYVLRVVADDSSRIDEGDFECCWTNGEIKVKVQ